MNILIIILIFLLQGKSKCHIIFTFTHIYEINEKNRHITGHFITDYLFHYLTGKSIREILARSLSDGTDPDLSLIHIQYIVIQIPVFFYDDMTDIKYRQMFEA